ncbi:MAG: dipeptidase [Arcanobacterium sp.]
MSTETIAARVDAALDQHIADLKEFVGIESVSADAFDQATLQDSAQWVARQATRLGLTTEIIELETSSGLVGRPAVLAHRPATPGKPTVLLYAHHDVQPPGDAADWDSPAFAAEVRNGRLYGRGSADDKAGVLVHLGAIAAADPGVGIRLFVEGEEEIGSPTFVDFLKVYRQQLAADVIIVADSSNWKVGIPSLTTSLRGVVRLDVTVRGLDHALHSGMFGGPALDAVVLASRLIATLHDEHGDVTVPGLLGYDTTEVDYPEDELRRDAGILDGVKLAGSGSFTSRLWTKPAISVIGMDVTPVDMASNTLIPAVNMAISLRVAPGQDSAQAGDILAAYLRANAPLGAQVDVAVSESGPAFEAGEDTPAAQMFRDALEQAWGVEPVDIGQGGSIPFIADFAEQFPDAQILVTGIEDPDTRAHGANESVHLGDFRNAIVAEALFLTELGK